MLDTAETAAGDIPAQAPDNETVDPQAIEWPPELTKIAQEARTGSVPPRATVRTLLSWFYAQRRGSFIVWQIRSRLKKLGIKTDPDFNSAWIDSEISFVPVSDEEAEEANSFEEDSRQLGTDTSGMLDAALATEPLTFIGGAIEDPTYRIGKLDAANKPIVSVAPNHSIRQAITLMLINGFSQVPVMNGEREVKGILTWESIGARLSLGRPCTEARECMTSPQIISSDKSLFAAIEIIAQYQYVLIQASDRKITGIVTAADLSRQFQQLTEPFLLLGEIEQHIRSLIVNKFTSGELRAVCDPSDQERDIHSVADLTMGEYILLLENPQNWQRLNLGIDRSSLIERLKAVKRIRNDIMHFDPDPLGPNDLYMLRQFVVFMQSLRELTYKPSSEAIANSI